ncbi:EndoU domain-containing protein [Micromonospora sp. NPDC049114]|uniref:EndoU domain-containing protein n=1 Tax=Micromonospora sp. NPDC049114 TaxID=3155498 RepID=UPI00340C89F1
MDDWQVLDLYDGDPTPGEPASIQAMAADLQRRAAAANGHHVRLRSIAASSGALALRGDFAATVDRELAQLPDQAKALADAYLAGAQALSAFANELARAQAQSRAALRLAMAADSQYRNLLGQFCGLTGRRTYGPGVWRGLNESYAAGQREPVFTMVVRIGQAARLCEAEREQARASALAAKSLYQAAAARCATAIRAALAPLGRPQPGGSPISSGPPTTVRMSQQRPRAGSSGSGATNSAPTQRSAPRTPPASTQPTQPAKPTRPPNPGDIRYTDASKKHIIEGDGGRQGGHLAGTGLRDKTEFPKTWDESKIRDAAIQVTQQGPPVKGPYLTKDADGNRRWAYDYEGAVDGVKVKTTVLADGEIRTSYPVDPSDPGVIKNPNAPTPAPRGVPGSVAPRYSNPAVGGDGSWTWEGPKGRRIVRVVQDAQGNVTTTDLGPYNKR